MLQSCLFYFYSITDTCKCIYRDQSHDFMFNSTKVMWRNATKSWKFWRPFWYLLSDYL